jgi:hypothetical protein
MLLPPLAALDPPREIVRFTFTLLFKESQAQRGEVSSDSTRNPRDSLGTCLKKPFISLIGKPDDLQREGEGEWSPEGG